jgi:serine phosphatase RsbU (regulator of sigma subunit)
VLQIDPHDQHCRFSQSDLDLLASVVTQAALAIESAHEREETTQRRDIERQLEFASQVQMSFLPSQRPLIPGYQFYDYYEAALGIGGDFFDYVPLPDGRLVVALGDVAGKGVPAALLMARLHSMARYHFLASPMPARVLSELNAGLATCGLGHRFVTFVAAVLDPLRHEVTLVNAGHIPPLLVRPNGEVALVGGEASGFPLGICQEHEYGQFTLTLEPGETLLLFTDGVTEAMSGDDEIYGISRVRNFLAQPQRSVEELGTGLIADVEAFGEGRRQCDDTCVVGLQRQVEG